MLQKGVIITDSLFWTNKNPMKMGESSPNALQKKNRKYTILGVLSTADGQQIKPFVK